MLIVATMAAFVFVGTLIGCFTSSKKKRDGDDVAMIWISVVVGCGLAVLLAFYGLGTTFLKYDSETRELVEEFPLDSIIMPASKEDPYIVSVGEDQIEIPIAQAHINTSASKEDASKVLVYRYYNSILHWELTEYELVLPLGFEESGEEV